MPESSGQHGTPIDQPNWSVRSRGPVTLAELTNGLIWPRLLRALPMSLDLSRLVIGAIMLALVASWAALLARVGARTGFDGLSQVPGSMAALVRVPEGADGGLLPAWTMSASAALTDLGGLASTSPFLFLALLALIAPLWAVGGGAIARMVAVDLAGNVHLGASAGIGFAASRMKSLTVSLILPILGLGIVSLGLKIGGAILFGIPGLGIVGAALYPLFLIAGLLFVLGAIGLIVGHLMIIPAGVVEATDPVDAVQRALAYTLGRLWRGGLYLLVLIAQGALGFFVLAWLAEGVLALTAGFAGAWAGLPAPGRASGSLIQFWTMLTRFLVLGWLATYVLSASTIWYLLLRRVHDGQDISEIWMPSMVPGTLAPVEDQPADS